MAESQALAAAAADTTDEQNTATAGTASKFVPNGNEKYSPVDKNSENTEKRSVSAHTQDRQKNESARIEEAKKWNNRDRDRFRHDRHNGKHNQKDFKFSKHNNNKFDPTTLPETDNPVAIRKQVEFYFSDSNLLTDKFLFEKLEGHKNTPVPVDIIHSFKRMRHFQPRDAVVSALKESATLNLVNDDNDIQRKDPLPEGLIGKAPDEIAKVHEDESMARSIYAKGFGKEEASTQFDIEAFFANYGTTNSVRLRRYPDRTFKGSVFVEFDSEKTAKAFAAVDPRPQYKGKELLVKTKKEYCDGKVEDIKAGRIRPNSPDGQIKRGGYRDSRRNKDHRDLDKHDDRDWRLRRQDDAEKGFADDNRDDERSRRGGPHHESGRGRGGRARGRGRGRGRDRLDNRRSQDERSASPKESSKDEAAADRESDTAALKEAAKANAEDVSQTPTLLGDGADNEPNTSPGRKVASDGDRDAADAQATEGASKKHPRENDEMSEDSRQVKKVEVG